MKKILIATNIITASLLLFAFTRPGNTAKPETVQAGPSSPISLGVNMNVAKEMVENYRNGIWKGRKVRNYYYKDARSVWFSLAKLKNFIADIELKIKGGKEIKCDIDDFDLGVRIYFGNYPDSNWQNPKYGNYFNNHMLPETYRGLHTVMMVPTLYNVTDGFNYDFDPRFINANGKKCEAYRIDSVMKLLQAANNITPPNEYIANNEFYSIMPDNRDSKGLSRKEFIPGTPTNAKKATKTPETTAGTTSTNVDFTNAGTLIPPPYPEDVTAQRTSLTNKYYVPCSGASFMRWVDGTYLCGWYNADISTKSLQISNTKQQ